MKGGYETPDGGSFEFEFAGPASDAVPVREFLEAQFRGAGSSSLRTEFRLAFENGLSMQGDAAEKLADRLGRFGAAAHVWAEARGKA